MVSARLTGKRVLLVEDEAIIALSIEDMLRAIGCSVVGPAYSVAQGMELAASAPLDAAVLDINMRDGSSFSIADLLRARSVPFCFSTGYGSAGVPEKYTSIPVLPKPYPETLLAASLEALLS